MFDNYNKNNQKNDSVNTRGLQLKNRLGFEAYLAEEDYGYVDVIVLHKW